MPGNLNIWGVFWTNQVQMGAECSREVASWRRVADAIRSLVIARDLQLECPRVLHELLLVLILMYGSETMLWKKKERSRVRAV